MYIIGVYQKRTHTTNYTGEKKAWYVYYIDDDNHFKSFRTTWLKHFWYKLFRHKVKSIKY